MQDQEIYDHANPDVKETEVRVHRDLVRQVEERMGETGMNKNRLTKAMGAKVPMTYRFMDPEANLTLNTMVRAALALGCDIDVRLVPKDPK